MTSPATGEAGNKHPGGRPRKYPNGSRPLWIRLSPALLKGLGGACASNGILRKRVMEVLAAYCGLEQA